MGSHSLLQGIFPTQGSNPGLLHCRQIPYYLSHQGSFPDGLPLWASPVGFPAGSDSKEAACNAGDLGSNPGSGRSPGEGNGYPSSILVWRIPRTEEPGGLQSMRLQRVGLDWVINTSLHFCVCCLHTQYLNGISLKARSILSLYLKDLKACSSILFVEWINQLSLTDTPRTQPNKSTTKEDSRSQFHNINYFPGSFQCRPSYTSGGGGDRLGISQGNGGYFVENAEML